MNCTRVLSALGSHPAPGIDLAMRLSQTQPLYELLSMTALKQAQHNSLPSQCLQRSVNLRTPRHLPSLSYSPTSAVPPCTLLPWVPRSCFRRDSSSQAKKRVVFADAVGRALTAVRLFSPDSSILTPTLLMKHSPVNLPGPQPLANKPHQYKLRLGFPQPDLDISQARVREMCVMLESCSVLEHSLSGRVRVSHASTEKAVNVRVTFDSWLSYQEIPCTFLHQQRFSSSEVDVFAFNIILPKKIDPEERIEFWVSLMPGDGTVSYWDDNNGQNYRVCVDKDRPNDNQSNAKCFYSMLSKYRPPSFYSQLSPGVQDSADPLYFQSSLPSRVIPRWEAVSS